MVVLEWKMFKKTEIAFFWYAGVNDLNMHSVHMNVVVLLQLLQFELN